MIIPTAELRSLTLQQIAERYRGVLPTAEGKTFDETIMYINNIMKVLGITLTNEQYNIILSSVSSNKAILVDSCAGSGKTTLSQILLLVYEFIYKIPATSMLCMTFTRKSADDMKARHRSFCEKFGARSYVLNKTMHSIYNHYVEKYVDRLGIQTITGSLQILSKDSECRNIIRSIYCSVYNLKSKYDVSVSTIKALHEFIIFVKDNCYDSHLEDVAETRQFKDLNMDFSKFIQIYNNYINQNKTLGRIDYSDMQLCFYRLLKENPDIKAKFHKQYRVVVVDEMQDTSKIQLRILNQLVSPTAKLFVIGDPDQSIYAWRGANKESYLEFQKYYDTELHTMGVNMRCPNNIINHASKLLSFNKSRHVKDMLGTDKEGKIDIVPCKSSQYAYKYVEDKIYKYLKEHNNDLESLKKIAVLYRNHSQAMLLVHSLLSKRIPLNVTGGALPYHDKIVKDFIEIYQMLLNPTDIQLAVNNLFKICKGVYANARSKKDIKTQMENMLGGNIVDTQFDVKPLSILDLHFKGDDRIIKEDKGNLKELVDLVQDPKITVSKVAEKVLPLYYNNYYDYIAKKQMVDSEHINNIFTYLTCQFKSYNTFMSETKEILQTLADYNAIEAGITFSSMHGIKGLEYDHVIVLCSNGNSNPKESVLENLDTPIEYNSYLTEEMNLFYVSITRAKKSLTMTYIKSNPSRFCIMADLCNKKDAEQYIECNPDYASLYLNNDKRAYDLAMKKRLDGLNLTNMSEKQENPIESIDKNCSRGVQTDNKLLYEKESTPSVNNYISINDDVKRTPVIKTKSQAMNNYDINKSSSIRNKYDKLFMM